MTAKLLKISSEIWIYEGSTVSFYGFPFPTRMTVIKLHNGDLWIHSPEKLTDELRQELAALGTIKHLVSPNKLHHLFLPEWKVAYPDAINYAAPGLSRKRRDFQFDVELSSQPEAPWQDEIDQVIFTGSPVMEEVVFFHRPSQTLILTDLIENFKPETLTWFQRKLAAFVGILSPTGKMPIDWRISFLFGSKAKARESLNIMLNWAPKHIVLSHGECIFDQGTAFLRTSFSWLTQNNS